ncbi:MAG TPA: diacylglycerol kinase family protein, partial [Pirellulales bacterium]|nr:diacylglycerol kinase family protein [Pirellulales bacterium]
MPTAAPPSSSLNCFRLDERRDHVVLAVNPKSGARCTRHLVEELADRLRAQNYHAEILTDLEHIAERANSLQAQGRLRTLVGAGGDGTAAELVNRTVAGVPLTVFPAGTENLLAKYLRLKADPYAISHAIDDGCVVRFDAGWACPPGRPDQGRVFLLMADCGFDAEVVRLLHDERAGHISRFTYGKPFFQALRRYQHPEMRIHVESVAADQNGSDRACGASPLLSRWMFVFNLPCYAQGLKIAPRAVATDGWLDLCSFQGGSTWHVFKYLLGVLMRRHTRFKDCHMQAVKRLRIEADQ